MKTDIKSKVSWWTLQVVENTPTKNSDKKYFIHDIMFDTNLKYLYNKQKMYVLLFIASLSLINNDFQITTKST